MFTIQICSPRTAHQYSVEESVGAAIESVFPLMTEDAIMNWNHVRVPINYKYDLSVVWEDVINMLRRLASQPAGNTECKLASSTLRATWHLSWRANRLEVSSEWHEVVGDVQSILNQRNRIDLPLDEFLAEWKLLLIKVVEALQIAGYTQNTLPGLADVITVQDQISKVGKLYQTD
jgi:hypothetical protein